MNGEVTLANWRQPQHLPWAVANVNQVLSCHTIACDPESSIDLPRASASLDGISVRHGGRDWSLEEYLDTSATDGICVLHRGQIALERYFGHTRPDTPHLLYSVSKSALGLLAGILIHRGDLSAEDPVTRWLPEAAGSAWDGATVRHLLDMQCGVRFNEVPLSDSPEVTAYRMAHGWDPPGDGVPPADLRGFLASLSEADAPHGVRFHYGSVTSDMLGWTLERAADHTYADLVDEFLWRPMGAASDALVTTDRLGAARASAGLCASLTDLARFGLVMARRGRGPAKRVAPENWIDDIFMGGDAGLWLEGNLAPYFPREPLRYRSHWYAHGEERRWAFAAGVHGQYLFVDPDLDIVVAKLSSHRTAFDYRLNALALRAADAIRDRLAAS